jgi:hypothetical protein
MVGVQVGWRLGNYALGARHAQETRQHLGPGAPPRADDLANGELAVAAQMPVAEAAVDQQQLAPLGTFIQGIKDHRLSNSLKVQLGEAISCESQSDQPTDVRTRLSDELGVHRFVLTAGGADVRLPITELSINEGDDSDGHAKWRRPPAQRLDSLRLFDRAKHS